MGTEGSLPHSQEPNTCPYSEPHKSSSCSIPFLKQAFQYYPPI